MKIWLYILSISFFNRHVCCYSKLEGVLDIICKETVCGVVGAAYSRYFGYDWVYALSPK